MTLGSRTLTASALAFGLAATAAHGQDQHILEMERDADGGTTYESFGRSFADAGLFDAYDADGDGVLTRDELSRGVFASCDRDRDDYLSTEETETLIDAWDAPVKAGLHGTEQDSGDPGVN